jgi:centromeric protein E
MGSNSGEEAMPGSTGEERILVSVRVRPLNDKEVARNDLSEWACINALPLCTEAAFQLL